MDEGDDTARRPVLLTVPGYTGSGPRHWQSLWERKAVGVSRVVQDDWDRPSCPAWVARLDEAVRASETPTVLVAHSLGCATVVHWLHRTDDPGPVVGALLVAPADVDRSGWPVPVGDFAPMPLAPLGVETTVVASGDDPWVELDRARQFAERWGSSFVDAGELGHVDSDSDLGEWPAGWRILAELLQRCGVELLPLGDVSTELDDP